jgi:hypothetical protein
MIRRIDMPIVARHRTLFTFGRLRLARSCAAIVKRAYPIILVLAIFGGVLAATIALRVAIWLPISFLLNPT